MQFTSRTKTLIFLGLSVLVGITALVAFYLRWQRLRNYSTSLNIPLSSGSLDQIRVTWPLNAQTTSQRTYQFMCAVGDIVENNEGRMITPELSSMLDVRCRYLASDGSLQELLIPMAFVLETTDGPQSFVYNQMKPTPMRYFPGNAKQMLVELQGLNLGKVLLVDFNVIDNVKYQFSMIDQIGPEVTKVLTQKQVEEFAQTGHASVFADRFLPLQVGIGVPDPYPDNINLQ